MGPPRSHGKAKRRPQKPLQILAKARRAAAPPTNRALHEREKAQQARADSIVRAEMDLQRRMEERAHGGSARTNIQLADAARAFDKNPRPWLALDYAVPPWDNQREVIPRLMHCCETPCPDGGGMGALFREDMGRGKTLALYLYLWEQARRRVQRGQPRFGQGAAALILVPKTLLGQWEEQWQRWMGVERLGVLFLPPGHELDVDLDWFHHCVDAVVMTYETLVGAIRDERTAGLLSVHWRHLVVEEGTTLSHEETHLFDACARVQADARILISAEPLLNARTRELNGILAFFGCKTRLPLALDDDDADTRPDLAPARERRRALLAHFDVHSTKPIGLTRSFDARRDPQPQWVTLRDDERQHYNLVLNTFKLTKERDERLRALTVLRKIVLSSHLLYDPEDRDPDRRPSSKMEAVLLYLQRCLAPDEKALVFCDWQRAHVELAFHLTRRGIPHAILDASLTPLQRQLLVARFSMPDGPRVVLVTYKLSVGMDGWQCANHVLLMSGWWHNKVERQALGRIERPGQTRTTHFYKFIVADSIDHYMLNTNISKETRGSRVFGALEEPAVQGGLKRVRDESDAGGEEEEEDTGEPARKKPCRDARVC